MLMRGETWDDPAKPILRSSDYVGRVGPGSEFAFAPEAEGGLVVVPVSIDLGPDRVDLTYASAGAFATARFNGYVLTFPVECTLLDGARIDRAATTLALKADDVTVGPQELRVNVADLSYAPGDRIGLLLDVTDCPIS